MAAPLTDFARRFAAIVGITPQTAAAWQRSENGPADNPLNLGGAGNLGHYSDPVAASAAFLTSGDKAGYYKGILAARGNPAAEVAAIRASPFDASHYANGVLDRTAAEYGIGGVPSAGVPAAPAALAPLASNYTPAAAPAASQSSSLAPLLGLISQNQQTVGLPGLSPLLLALAAQTTHATAPAVAAAPQTANAPTVVVQGNVTKRVQGAVSLVKEYLGTPYVWGGEKPGGFDCSGLLQYVWAKQGVNIPRVTYDQFKAGTPVAKSHLQPGDAVFFTGSDPKGGLPGHVGMYLGGGKFIEAPHTGATVRISNLASRGDFVGARRYA